MSKEVISQEQDFPSSNAISLTDFNTFRAAWNAYEVPPSTISLNLAMTVPPAPSFGMPFEAFSLSLADLTDIVTIFEQLQQKGNRIDFVKAYMGMGDVDIKGTLYTSAKLMLVAVIDGEDFIQPVEATKNTPDDLYTIYDFTYPCPPYCNFIPED
jgi:hypothetical protein